MKITAGTRTAQKTYFRNRSAENLEKSKLLERKLDVLLAELSKGREIQPLTQTIETA